MKTRLQYQRAVYEDQAMRQEHMAEYARTYQPPKQTRESIEHQKAVLSRQKLFLSGEKSRIFTQIKLIDQHIILVGAFMNLLNSTSSPTTAGSGEESSQHEQRSLLEERVELGDQRKVMEHAELRMDYNEALMDDTQRHIESFENNQRKAESSGQRSDRSKLSDKVVEIDITTKRLEYIISLIDRNVEGLDTLTKQLTHSKTFGTQLLIDEKRILEDQKSKYIQHVNTYKQQKSDLLYALSSLQ